MKQWVKRISKVLVGGFVCLSCMSQVTEAVGRNVPEDIFQWVQSTSMSSYYFNKEQICYGVKSDGYIDLNQLIVPTIKIYSAKQIEDVVQKRRWRMEKLDGYDKLVGAADYLRFDIAANTVVITEHDDLDMNWWPLSKSTDFKPVKIDTLSEKAVDGIFYRAILKWADENKAEIVKHTTRGTLSPEDKAKFEESKDDDSKNKSNKKHKKHKKENKDKKTADQAADKK